MAAIKFNLEDMVGYHIGKTFKIMHFSFQRLLEQEGFDISSDQWIILVYLMYKNGVTQQFLTRIITKDKATMTRIIDDLEKKKYVTRVPGKIDRREKTISLTDSGRKYIEKVYPFIKKTEKYILKNITNTEYETLKKVLKQISDNILEDLNSSCKGVAQKA
jgi:DNA-binding MarR family transcriptional regulator